MNDKKVDFDTAVVNATKILLEDQKKNRGDRTTGDINVCSKCTKYYCENCYDGADCNEENCLNDICEDCYEDQTCPYCQYEYCPEHLKKHEKTCDVDPEQKLLDEEEEMEEY